MTVNLTPLYEKNSGLTPLKDDNVAVVTPVLHSGVKLISLSSEKVTNFTPCSLTEADIII
jgi:hypothetical protein